MFFRQITDCKLAQLSYLIGCESSGKAIVIDPQRDIEKYFTIADETGLRIVAATETHIHADFLSGLRQMAVERHTMVYASGEGGDDWQYEWLKNSDLKHKLLRHGDSFNIGTVRFEVSHTPGHTPEHIIFALTDTSENTRIPLGFLTGDFIFVGDVGRPDLLETAAGLKGKMQPAARELYESLQMCKNWPENCHIWPGHGAGSACGKAIGATPSSTLGQELVYNQSLVLASDKEKFVRYILVDQPEPPYYFARMKRENKSGPAILDGLPSPKKMNIDDVRNLTGNGNSLLLDCRTWPEYRDGHIPGSLFTPIDSSFPTIAGSYIEPDKQLILLVDSHLLSEAITDLINVGLDSIMGYLPVSALYDYQNNGGTLQNITEIDVAELGAILSKSDTFLLDVRRRSELNAVGQIEGATNIAHTRLLPDGSGLPDDREIHVYCRSGNRSTYASAFLERSGHKVIHIAGGFLAWEAAGHKVVFPR